jgi:hypothetical protein
LSIATDFDFQHSFKKEQRYWAVGQTVNVHFHFTPKEGVYAWISYYTEGKFQNKLVALARSSTTVPQQVDYVNDAKMRFKQISMGWKHYLKGAFDIDEKWSLYGYAGFGLVLGRVINSQSMTIDTSLYSVQVRNGKANFKRLTLDLGLGYEIYLGGDVYFYNEARVWIPTTDYPSKYLFINKNAPFMGSLNFGIRILFD